MTELARPTRLASRPGRGFSIVELLVVILGGIVGTIVLALFLPLVSMIESVSSAKV